MITVNSGKIPFILRPWQESDIPALVQNANNKKIADNMTDSFPHPYGPENGKMFIDRVSAGSPANVMAIVIDNEACGSIGAFPQGDINRLNAEFGYWLAEKYWGNGIITEAVKAMVPYVFKNFPIERIFARPFEHNIASQKLLEKTGFTLEARIPKSLIKNGVVMDELIYAIRRNQY